MKELFIYCRGEMLTDHLIVPQIRHLICDGPPLSDYCYLHRLSCECPDLETLEIIPTKKVISDIRHGNVQLNEEYENLKRQIRLDAEKLTILNFRNLKRVTLRKVDLELFYFTFSQYCRTKVTFEVLPEWKKINDRVFYIFQILMQCTLIGRFVDLVRIMRMPNELLLLLSISFAFCELSASCMYSTFWFSPLATLITATLIKYYTKYNTERNGSLRARARSLSVDHCSQLWRFQHSVLHRFNLHRIRKMFKPFQPDFTYHRRLIKIGFAQWYLKWKHITLLLHRFGRVFCTFALF